MRFRTCLTALFLLGLSATALAQQSDNYRGNLRDQNIKIEGSALPIVFLNVNHQTIQRDSYVLAEMRIVNGKSNYSDTLAHPGQKTNYAGHIALKYRGNSSFNLSDKKPFAFKTLKTADLNGKKDKVKLLGMAKDNTWALLAPFSDKSMMRDVLTFELSRPYMDFTPHARYCELILDGTYYGIYILIERPTKGSGRLDLHDPGEDGDLTGDFHVEIDRDDDPNYKSKYHPTCMYYSSELTLSNKDIKYQYKDPEQEDFGKLPVGTQNAINAAINTMEESFRKVDYTGPEGYRKQIDVTSWIGYLLATEFAMNIDGYRLSTNLYKYSDKRAAKEGLDPRWKMTLWDFNIAYGNADYFEGDRTNIWQYEFNDRRGFNTTDSELVPFYWKKLMADTAFVSEVKQRWALYRQGNFTQQHIMQVVDSISSMLTRSGAIDRNQKAYEIIGRYVWPNFFVGQTYEQEIGYLKRFIENRLTFMDEQLGFDPSGIATVGSGKQPKLRRIYTIDGRPISRPQRGVNILKYSDGTSKKVIIR